ncbi:MAG: response regulator [Bacteroidota bacterium]
MIKQAAQIKLLIVEDNLDDRMMIRRELIKNRLEFDIRVCEDREAFVLLLEKFDPHVVLSDYVLPDWSGLEAYLLCQEVKPQVPFIFVSGAVEEHLAEDSVLNKAFGFVLKNKLEELGLLIEKAVNLHYARIQLSNFISFIEDTNTSIPKLLEAYHLFFELDDCWAKEGDITLIKTKIQNMVKGVRNGIF